MPRRFISIAGSLLLITAAHAADLYRWVDETGRAQFGETVPEKYKASASKTDCATWQRLYAESQECFAPYKGFHGLTRGEAYEKCVEIPDPVTTCGLPKTP